MRENKDGEVLAMKSVPVRRPVHAITNERVAILFAAISSERPHGQPCCAGYLI